MTETLSPTPTDRRVMRGIGMLTAVAGALSVGFGVARVVTLVDGTAKVNLLAGGSLPDSSVPAAITAAEVSASTLDQSARGLLIAGTAVDVVTVAIITVALVSVLLRVAAGDPFHRSMFRVGVVAGFALLVGGMVGTGLRGFGQMQAAMTLNGDADGPFESAFTFEPGWWWLAFVVLALAYVFRAGTRLQSDTERLV